MTEDELAHHLRDRGIADPEAAWQWNTLEIDSPARQLVDARWVWLPSVLAGRVFTHRLSADELTHDLVTVSPDLTRSPLFASTRSTSGSPTDRRPAWCFRIRRRIARRTKNSGCRRSTPVER